MHFNNIINDLTQTYTYNQHIQSLAKHDHKPYNWNQLNEN